VTALPGGNGFSRPSQQQPGDWGEPNVNLGADGYGTKASSNTWVVATSPVPTHPVVLGPIQPAMLAAQPAPPPVIPVIKAPPGPVGRPPEAVDATRASVVALKPDDPIGALIRSLDAPVPPALGEQEQGEQAQGEQAQGEQASTRDASVAAAPAYDPLSSGVPGNDAAPSQGGDQVADASAETGPAIDVALISDEPEQSVARRGGAAGWLDSLPADTALALFGGLVVGLGLCGGVVSNIARPSRPTPLPRRRLEA